MSWARDNFLVLRQRQWDKILERQWKKSKWWGHNECSHNAINNSFLAENTVKIYEAMLSRAQLCIEDNLGSGCATRPWSTGWASTTHLSGTPASLPVPHPQAGGSDPTTWHCHPCVLIDQRVLLEGHSATEHSTLLVDLGSATASVAKLALF